MLITNKFKHLEHFLDKFKNPFGGEKHWKSGEGTAGSKMLTPFQILEI